MLLLIAAAPLETILLRQQLRESAGGKLSDYTLFAGNLRNQQIMLAHGGLGPVAMTMQLTRLLERHEFSAVLLFGCGGSYPDSDLKIGELALARSEIFGDLGIATESGFTPLEQLEIAEQAELAPVCRQEFTLSESLLSWAKQVLPEARCGKFVTVNSCSGTPLLSAQLAQRTGGICENMEGAAVAQVCAEFNLPLLEIRGISNPTGTRDPDQWNIKLGTEAAQQAVMRLLEFWPPGD